MKNWKVKEIEDEQKIKLQERETNLRMLAVKLTYYVFFLRTY
jgi:hypothetical protein